MIFFLFYNYFTYLIFHSGIQSSAIETRVEVKTEKPETCSTESNDEDTSPIENTESICTIDKVGPLVDSGKYFL